MPRGGKRRGKPGAAYGNRSDMNLSRVAPGQTYGKGVEQQRAMQAVPPSAPPSPEPGPPAEQSPDLMAIAQDSWQPLPGSPTDDPNPDKPLTAGLDIGAGPGSEALAAIQRPPNPDMQGLIRMLPLLEQMANNSGSSVQTRNLYRNVLAAHLQQPGGL